MILGTEKAQLKVKQGMGSTNFFVKLGIFNYHAPLSEQQRIVAKLDAALLEIETIKLSKTKRELYYDSLINATLEPNEKHF